jgi:hypothetical protein
MMLFSSKDRSLENKLIGNILREYPLMSKIIQRYFGGHCLKKPSFKIKTLEAACILFGVDQNRLIQEIEKIQN